MNKKFIKNLEDHYKEGWLIKQTHPTLPLTIWNYSQKTQFERFWNSITLQCRGLVTDDQGNIVARPFRKFFNIEEHNQLPDLDFEVFEKMDGSLGICFIYSGEVVYATRGSFTSDQALWMKDYGEKYNFKDILVEGYTYLFEIIYPKNRIVVDYGNQEKLVLLGIIHNDSQRELEYEELQKLPFEIVKKYNNVKDYSLLKNKVKNNQEGFVLKFSNGLRVKIKGEEYIRLHKIMTEISTKSIWECLKNGQDMYKFLEDVPDEYFDKIDSYIEDLKSEYLKIEAKAQAKYNRYKHLDKKEYAGVVKWNKYSSILFAMYNNKEYSNIIWKMLKPDYRKL